MKPAKLVVGACAVALSVAGCSSSGGSPSAPSGSSRPAITAEPPGTGTCDDTDPAACLLPFPNDRFTRAIRRRRRAAALDLPAAGMPANKAGKRIDATEWDRNDGFSPSSIGLTVVPNLDAAASGLPPQTDIAASLAPGAHAVVVDVNTGKRVPAWAEIDPRVTDPAQRLLRIVPAVGLAEGHRIAIGLRGLRHTDGTPVAPTAAFAKLVAAPTPEQSHWLDALAVAGVPKASLTIAWSFTVESEQSLSGRLRHMWSETSAALGRRRAAVHGDVGCRIPARRTSCAASSSWRST